MKSPHWRSDVHVVYPPLTSRKVFAAAHVAAVAGPGGAPAIDWESTLRFREHLWAHGFGVAEAMDTAQRGMGLSWQQASELIDTDRLFTQLSSYKHNPRVRILSLGRSVQGADVPLVAIGEPAVLVDLEGACRKAALYYTPRIAHRTWDAVDAIVTELPLSPDVRIPVLIEGGTFGFEASHTEGLLQAIDYLATQDTEAVRQILSRTVALFIPMANPDGRDLAIRQWQAFPLSAGHDAVRAKRVA